MKAIGDNLVIQPLEQGVEETKGGLLLAHSQREDIRFNKAKVISVGKDVRGVKNKDLIYFDQHGASKIEINKNIYHVIKLRDVVVVL